MKPIFRALSVVLLALVASACHAADSMRVYVGTYTNPQAGGKGIYLFDLNLASGALKLDGVAAETASPSYLALSPDKRFLYSIGEVTEFRGKKSGVVSAFSVDEKSGKLTLLNQQPAGGAGTCHVSITSDGKNVLVANYTAGSVASFHVESDGKLGEPASIVQHEGKGTDPGRQEGPHAHGIWAAPGDRFVVACDLGLDKVMVYGIETASGKLTLLPDRAGSVPPGAGARHAAFDKTGQHLYAINEMGNSVTTFEYDAKAGGLTPIETVGTLPDDFHGKSYCAEIFTHPSGKFVYGSNRGHDSITVLSIDSSSGKLTKVDVTPARVKWPRNFNVDPTGQWLIAAGEHSGTLSVFKIDPRTGKLTPTGEPVECPAPGCVTFVPNG
jgi:6-phosphogluconolactonase